MANPVNASETGGWHGRLADWSSQSLAVLLWNFPTVFFCVKKCNRCFLLHDFMSWTICKIKQHDIRIEFQFFSQQTKSYKIQISIHLPWWDQFYLLRFASLIGSGTCWSQQKKQQNGATGECLHSQLHMDPYGNLKYPLQSHFWRCFSFSLCRIC